MKQIEVFHSQVTLIQPNLPTSCVLAILEWIPICLTKPSVLPIFLPYPTAKWNWPLHEWLIVTLRQTFDKTLFTLLKRCHDELILEQSFANDPILLSSRGNRIGRKNETKDVESMQSLLRISVHGRKNFKNISLDCQNHGLEAYNLVPTLPY